MSETHRSTPAFASRILAVGLPDAVFFPRRTAERCRDLAERVLAFSGENPDPELIQLQHELTELIQPNKNETCSHDGGS